MWFVWLAIALALLVGAGMYVRRRVISAIAAFGVGRRGQTIASYLVLWLLFGYPVIAFSTVGVVLVLGGEQMGPPEHALVTWGLVVPFFWAALVVGQSMPYLVVIDVVAWVRRKLSKAPPGMTRRRAGVVLGVIGAFAVYTPARILWERNDLDWRHHEVKVTKDTVAAAPPPRFRIGFIADVQQDTITDAAYVEGVTARLGNEQLDLVLSGGDWINMGPNHIAAAARSAAQVRSRLGTFSVRGDHEHFAYVDRQRSVNEVSDAMQSRGVAMLHNEVRRFDHHGRTIAVVFLTFSYPARTAANEIESLIASVADADVSVLVTHQLDSEVAAMARDRIDLVLAAHTHGGQVNPVLGVWHVPLARIETPYVDGRYQLGATTLVVTAGVGYSIVPFRYASVGSVDVIDLVW
ncbi:MAG: metallophosphoesterase [Kofleriaceae bacterium]